MSSGSANELPAVSLLALSVDLLESAVASLLDLPSLFSFALSCKDLRNILSRDGSILERHFSRNLVKEGVFENPFKRIFVELVQYAHEGLLDYFLALYRGTLRAMHPKIYSQICGSALKYNRIDLFDKIQSATGRRVGLNAKSLLKWSTKSGEIALVEEVMNRFCLVFDPNFASVNVIKSTAAARGHLKLLQWAMTKQPRATVDMIEVELRVAGRGGTELLSWLWNTWHQREHLTPSLHEPLRAVLFGCAVDALRFPGTLPAVKFCISNGEDKEGDFLIVAAAQSGNIAALNWIMEEPRRPVGAHGLVVKIALKGGHVDFVERFLTLSNFKPTDPQLLRSFLDHAVMSMRYRVVKYALEKWPSVEYRISSILDVFLTEFSGAKEQIMMWNSLYARASDCKGVPMHKVAEGYRGRSVYIARNSATSWRWLLTGNMLDFFASLGFTPIRDDMDEAKEYLSISGLEWLYSKLPDAFYPSMIPSNPVAGGPRIHRFLLSKVATPPEMILPFFESFAFREQLNLLDFMYEKWRGEFDRSKKTAWKTFFESPRLGNLQHFEGVRWLFTHGVTFGATVKEGAPPNQIVYNSYYDIIVKRIAGSQELLFWILDAGYPAPPDLFEKMRRHGVMNYFFHNWDSGSLSIRATLSKHGLHK